MDPTQATLYFWAYMTISWVIGYISHWFYIKWPKKKKELDTGDGSTTFMMKEPEYLWVFDPQDTRLLYLVDKSNRVIYPGMSIILKEKGDTPPKIGVDVKNQVQLLSPNPVSIIEFNRYAAFKATHKHSSQSFINFTKNN